MTENVKTDFDEWVEDLQNQEQPEQCNIENQDECDSCGS